MFDVTKAIGRAEDWDRYSLLLTKLGENHGLPAAEREAYYKQVSLANSVSIAPL